VVAKVSCTHLDERQVAVALDQLVDLQLLVFADGVLPGCGKVIGVPSISTMTEGRSTERQRERRAATTTATATATSKPRAVA